MGPSPDAPRTQEERVAETSQRLLNAAIELIAERGYDRTTTAAIGKRAGYSHGVVNVRFGNKDALLESILRSYERAMLPTEAEGVSGLDLVLGQLGRARERAIAEPEFFRAFCVLCFETAGPAASLRPWVADWFGRYVAETAARLRAGQSDGSVRVDVDAGVEAQWLFDAGVGMAFRWLIDPEKTHIATELAGLCDRVSDQLRPR